MIKNLMNKKKKGFTLIELIIVIAIIAILAAIAVPQFSKIRANANAKTDLANAKTIHSAVSALIANEQITLPTNDTNKALNISLKDTQEQIDIQSYLETIPQPKSVQSSDFIVDIDKNGNTKVYIVKDGIKVAPSTGVIYPN